MAWYKTGTVAVTNGSAAVTGSLTEFLTHCKVGDIFTVDKARIYEIQSVDSDTQVTLHESYAGSTDAASAYYIIPNFTNSLNAEVVSRVIDLIDLYETALDNDFKGDPGMVWKGAYSAGVQYAQDDVVGYGGSSWIAKAAVMNVTPTEGASWGKVADKGATGDAAPNVKVQFSADASTWSDTYTAGDVYARFSTDNGATWGSAARILGEKGDTGAPGTRWLGAWSAETTYVLNDGVSHGGRSFVALSENTNSEPPAAGNATWLLVADRGADGQDGTNGTNGADGGDGAWECDLDGNLIPREVAFADPWWELDGDGDLIPKEVV